MIRHYVCTTPDCENPVENQDTGLCGTCGFEMRKFERQQEKEEQKIEKKRTMIKNHQSPIAKVSGKMAGVIVEYSKEKGIWIPGKMCVVFPDKPAIDVHHRKGKTGYADKWARTNGITLFMDKRFWYPVSREGHIKITANTQWARDNGFDLPRNESPD